MQRSSLLQALKCRIVHNFLLLQVNHLQPLERACMTLVLTWLTHDALTDPA